MKNGFYLILIAALSACGGSEEGTEAEDRFHETPKGDTSTVEEPEIEVPTMFVAPLDEWPEEIEECSCGLSLSKEAYESNEYIYADDLMESAYMNIDGERIKFSAVAQPNENGEDEIGYRWNSEEYIIHLNRIDEPHDGESEGTYQKGKLILEHIMSGAKKEFSIYGFCGC